MGRIDETVYQGDQFPKENKSGLQQLEGNVPIEWKIGDVILDTYEVKEIFTSGGMGLVYRVQHRNWNIDLAVKSPRSEYFQTEIQRANFIRECETWINLGLHPHIVSCYYIRTLGGIPRIFAEYMEGGSLKQWIDTHKLYEGGPEKTLRRMLDIAIQFAWGLHYAHNAGLVHQDVKPANVMMTPDGTVKVTDFGLAKARGLAGAAPMVVGYSILVSTGGMTLAYCSPEQAQHQPLTRRTDIWSWGVSVLEMFVGEVTWLAGQVAGEALAGCRENGPKDKLIPAMPTALADLLQRCFLNNPNERPKDMAEVSATLQQIYVQVTGQTYTRQMPQASELQADGLNNQALSLYDLGRMKEAETLWKNNLQVNPGHLETTYNLGVVLWRTAQKDDAGLLRDLQAAATSSNDWRLGWLTSQVHLERGDVTQALAILDALPQKVAALPEVVTVRRQAKELRGSGHCLSRTFEGHTEMLNSVCLSADGRYALSGSGRLVLESIDNTLKLWNVAPGKCIRTFEGHTMGVLSVCLSADGRYALSGGADRTIKLWELATGKCLRTFEGHKDNVYSVCLHEDRRYALSGSSDRTLKLWEVSTGQCVRTFEGHTGGVFSVCLSPNGRYALSGSGDRTLKLWDLATGKWVRQFSDTEMVLSVCLSVDGRYALSGSWDHTLKLWELASWENVRTFEGHTDIVHSVCLSADGRYALSGSSDQALKLWDLATGKCVRTLEGHSNVVNSVCLSADGRFALSVSGDKTLKLWDLAPGYSCRAPFAISRIVTSEVVVTVERLLADALAARQCGEVVAEVQALRRARSVPGYEHNAEIREAWSRLYRKMRQASLHICWLARTLKGHTREVDSVCSSADGRYALSGSWDGTLKLWELETGQCVRTFEGHTGRVNSVCLSADGRYALSASSDNTLKLWKLATGKCVRTYKGHKNNVHTVCLSADGRYALSGDQDGTIKLWELATGKCVRTVEGHKDSVYSVCLREDGRYALSGDQDGTIKLWELATGQCVRTLEGHLCWVNSVCLSMDGRYALSGSGWISGREDNTLKLWDLVTGQCVRTFAGYTDKVASVCLSADGRYALSGGDQIKLWELATGQCVRTFEGHRGWVNSVCLSSDGRYALSGDQDGTIELWELDWELEENQPADWDVGAQPFLENFLTLHSLQISKQEGLFGFIKANVWNTPKWNENDFQQLLFTLGCAGYGWLRVEGVRRELGRMTKEWKGPRPLFTR